MKASRLAIVLSCFGVFCASSAFAQSRCESLFSSEYTLQGRVEVESAALQGPKAEDFAKTLSEIESLLSPLEIPKQSTVRVGTAFRASSFNAENFEIYVGLRPDSMGKVHPKINQTTLAHEYGHAIFEHNLLKDLESYKGIKEDALTLEKRLQEKVEEAKQLAYRSQVTFHNKEKKAELENLAIDKAYEAKAMSEKLQNMRRYWLIRSAHHELFADTIALVMTRDPKAVSDLLTSREKEAQVKKHSSNDINMRDFTDGRHHLNEQRWEKEQVLFSGFFGDVYYAFLPARWELWKITKNKIKSDNYRKALPYKVFSILERNLSESFAKDPQTLGNGFKDLQKMNQQIIEDFRREL